MMTVMDGENGGVNHLKRERIEDEDRSSESVRRICPPRTKKINSQGQAG